MYVLKNYFKVKTMKKIMMVGVILLAICLSISAASAFEWNFDFSSSDSTNTDGGSISLENNELKIQDLKYVIPEGYKENESAKILAEDADQDAFPGFKLSSERFDKGNDSIIIKVAFGDEEIDEEGYTPKDEAVAKDIGDISGYITEYNDGVSFDYIVDGKLVEIFAPDEETLSSLLESSNQ